MNPKGKHNANKHHQHDHRRAEIRLHQHQCKGSCKQAKKLAYIHKAQLSMRIVCLRTYLGKNKDQGDLTYFRRLKASGTAAGAQSVPTQNPSGSLTGNKQHQQQQHIEGIRSL